MMPLLKKYESRILLFIASIAFLIRFLDLYYSPFINDEPAVQMRIDEHFANHTFAWWGLRGTRGADYGPVAIWAYSPLRLFTDNVEWISAWHILFFGIAFLLFYFSLKNTFSKTIAAWIIALVCSAPFLFFYSRLPWDNTFLVVTSALVLFTLTRNKQNVSTWIFLGIAAALTFMCHVMSMSLLVALGCILILELKKLNSAKERVQKALGFAVGFGVTCSGYFAHSWRSIFLSRQFKVTASALTEVIPDTLSGLGRYFSSNGMEYFFDKPQDLVLNYFPAAMFMKWDLGLVLKGLSWVGVIMALLKLRKKCDEPILIKFAVASLFWIVIYYYGVRPLPFHPHYFMVMWWLLFLFLGYFISRSTQKMVNFTKLCIALLIFANLSFVLSAHSFIKSNSGTRGQHYGSIHPEIESMTKTACELLKTRRTLSGHMDLSRVPGIISTSVEFYLRHLSECKDMKLTFSPPHPVPKDGTAVLEASYRDELPNDARLSLKLLGTL